METLSEMERIEVDNKDRPIEDIVIIKAQVFVDPYQEADEQVFILFVEFLFTLIAAHFTFIYCDTVLSTHLKIA